MVVGDLVMLSGYIGEYVFAIMENDRLTLLDFVLKPFAIWGAVTHRIAQNILARRPRNLGIGSFGLGVHRGGAGR